MGDVWCQVNKEGLVLLLTYKTHGFVEEDICAVAFKLFWLSVAVVGVVEIVVTPVVCNLANSTAAQSDHIVKALILWSHRPVVTEMPFPVVSRGIAIVAEGFGNRINITAHHGAAKAGTPCTGMLCILP